MIWGLMDQINPLEVYINTNGPFYYHGLSVTPASVANYIQYKVWDEITYPFLNFNGATVEF